MALGTCRQCCWEKRWVHNKCGLYFPRTNEVFVSLSPVAGTHTVTQAERRSGAIAEVVNAYTAGLGYRPSTKGKKRRIVRHTDQNIDNGDGGGGDVDDAHGDTASETTAGTATTSTSVGTASSSSSRSNPAKDWWSDGGVSNRWAMSPSVRKTLFLSLQAGAVAHMSLKQRRAIEVPWVKVRVLGGGRGAENMQPAGRRAMQKGFPF